MFVFFKDFVDKKNLNHQQESDKNGPYGFMPVHRLQLRAKIQHAFKMMKINLWLNDSLTCEIYVCNVFNDNI